MQVRVSTDFFAGPRKRAPLTDKYFTVVSVGEYAEQDEFNEFCFHTVITFAHKEYGEWEFACITTGSRFYGGLVT